MSTVGGIGYNRTNISMPAEMNKFIDALLANPELSKARITHRNQLARACMEVYLHRLKVLSKTSRPMITPVKEGRYVNVTVPLDQAEEIRASTKFRILRTMWYPERSQIINALFRSLLVKYEPNYRSLNNNLFDISISDITERAAIMSDSMK